MVLWQKDAHGYPVGVLSQKAGESQTSYATGVTWDPQGRLATWSGGDGVSTVMQFDDATGRLEHVLIGPGGSIENLTYEYRDDDLVETITDTNDGERTRAFTYDRMKRLWSASGPFGPNRTEATHCYRYDAIGNLERMDATLSGSSCTGGQVFQYPVPTADRPHGPLTVGGVAVGYDAGGNTTGLFGRTYTYNGVGRLTSVKAGSTTLGSFQYDGNDRLIEVTGGGETKGRPADDWEWWQTAQQSRLYVMLGGQVIAVHAEGFVASGGGGGGGCAALPLPAGLPPGSGLTLLLLYGFAAVALAHVGLRLSPERRLTALVALGTGSAFLVVFVVPPGLRPARAQATPGITYYHQDHLGSTVIVTGGPAATRVVYAPFGKVVAETAGGSTAAPDVGFTGQRFEASVGIYDYGARWYHPDVGHFLTPDALVPDAYDSQLLNRYAYVRNNPINKIDPTGNTPIGSGDGWDSGGGSESWYWYAYDPFSDPFQALLIDFVLEPPPPPPPPPHPVEELQFWMVGYEEVAAELAAQYDARRNIVLPGDEIAPSVAIAFFSGGVRTVLGVVRAGIEELLPAVGLLPSGRARGVREGVEQAAEHVYRHGYKYDPRIRARGVQDPKAHNFPYSFDDEILSTTPVRQPDGSMLYQMPGTLNDTDGFYQVGVNPETQTIFHRTFVGTKK